MSTDLTRIVQDKYSAVATSGLSSDHAGVREVAEAFGYSAAELSSIPAEANMGLSCGNPTAMAHLKPGEVVVDLGCGGGLDLLLASDKIGPTGRAIGIDMTPAMVELARSNAAKAGATNIDIHLATIDQLPLPDVSVDIVISNCVINLAPDKSAVFKEIARVLKPGGRVAISDIALKRPLPDAIAKDVMAYVGCVAGALEIDDYRAKLMAAGLENVTIVDSNADLNAYAKVDGQSGCCSPTMSAESCCSPVSLTVGRKKISTDSGCCVSEVHSGLATLLEQYDINDYAASVKVFATKPCE